MTYSMVHKVPKSAFAWIDTRSLTTHKSGLSLMDTNRFNAADLKSTLRAQCLYAFAWQHILL
jgi:hypothetical protein